MSIKSDDSYSCRTETENSVNGCVDSVIQDNELNDALAIIEKYAAEGQALEELQLEILSVVADAFDILGRSDALNGNWLRARDCFSKNLGLRARIFTKTNHIEDSIKLSEAYKNCGQIEMNLKNNTDARKCYSDALYIAEKAFRETGSPSCLTLITDIHSQLEGIAKLQNDSESANYHYNSRKMIEELRTIRNI